MVVVLVISDLEFGGAQRQVVELANQLEKLHITAHVCSLSDYVPLASRLIRPDRLHIIARRWRFDLTVVARLALLLRRVRATVVHGFLFDAEIACRLAGRLARTPAVIGSERNTDYVSKPRDTFFFRLTRQCQDLVIANSRSGADFNRSLIGLPAGRYRVVRNGVNTDMFAPLDSQTIRRELGLPSHTLVVGMFASFKPQKNHGLLLDVARQLIDDIDGLLFLFVGDALHKGMSESDTYKAQLSAKVDELDIRRHCVFLGNRPDVERVYSACDVTVLPSSFEGTPNVLLESMACGVPVVATSVSDNMDIVRDGEVGFIVPPGDSVRFHGRLLQLLQDSSLRHQMGTRARQWALEEFSGQRLAERTVEAYRDALRLRAGVAAS